MWASKGYSVRGKVSATDMKWERWESQEIVQREATSMLDLKGVEEVALRWIQRKDSAAGGSIMWEDTYMEELEMPEVSGKWQEETSN